ncbi:MAG: hypothetical protein HEQ27_05300 [Dolichospermum sp. JUN01]|nr:hypothetical protein [Dolichospermum sp. JUN01]
MAQGNAVIGNLQSALDCAGKCDCCSNLQSQINDLRSQISTKIGQEEKPAIVEASVISAEQLIGPGLIALGSAINSLRPEIAAASAAATQAAQAAGTVLAQLAGIATQIAAILASIATLKVLGSRIDAVESLALSIGNNLSDALSLIASAKSMAEKALAEIDDLGRYVAGQLSGILSQVDARINALRIELEGIINARVSELKNLIKDIVATLSEIIARMVNIEIQLPSLGESIALLQSQVNSIFIRVGVLEGDTANIKQRVGVLEGDTANIKQRVGALERATDEIWAGIAGLTASIPVLVQEGIQVFVPPLIQTLMPPLVQTQVPPLIQTQVPPLIQTLTPPIVEGSIPGIVGNVTSGVNNWIFTILPSVVTNIVNNMIVDLSPVLQAIAKVDVKVDDTLEFIKTVDTTTKDTNAVAHTVNIKMGAPLPGGLAGWMLRFTSWSILDRLMNLLTLATTIHNAQQLSSNIFVTLITAMQNVLDLLGIKDSEGKQYSINAIIGQSVTSLTTLLIGQENYDNFVKEWAKYNRTYQAAGNLFSSLLNMGDTVTQALGVVSSQTGKIGNALKAWGVVSDKAYSWMNPNPNFSNPLLTKLNSLEETASMIENVTQQPLNVKSAKEEIDNAFKELSESLEQKDGSKQGSAIPEASKVKADQSDIVAASPGKDLTDADIEPDSEEA